MENPVLQTDCLTLRPLVISDLDDVFCWMGDERVTRYLTEVTYKAAEDGRAWISSLDGNDSAKEFGFELKETGGLIGSGGIYRHKEPGVWEMAFALRYDFWGRGLAFEGMAKIIGWARENLFVRVIEGTAAVSNIGSIRVMERLGMVFHADCEYCKQDMSARFRAKTFRRIFADDVI